MEHNLILTEHDGAYVRLSSIKILFATRGDLLLGYRSKLYQFFFRTNGVSGELGEIQIFILNSYCRILLSTFSIITKNDAGK